MFRSIHFRALLLSPVGAMTIAALVALPLLGARGLYHPTEGRYALCASEMLETGNWLIPTLEGEPHWSKPPLSYWAMASAMALFGRNDAGVRLQSALAFILTVGAIVMLGRTLYGRRGGGVAALVYATAPFPALMAWGASTDVLLTLLETFAVAAAARAAQTATDATTPPDRPTNWIRTCYASLGLAFLTKGPIAFIALVPIVVILRRSNARLRLLDPLAILAFLVTAFGWYGIAIARGSHVLDYWIQHEILDRALTDSAQRNNSWYKPFVIYGVPLAFGAGFWLVALTWRTAPHGAAKQVAARLVPNSSTDRLLLAWIAIPLVLLSLSQSRLPLYVLPLFPACALYLGPRIANALRGRRAAFCAILSGSIVAILSGKLVWAKVDTYKDMTALAAGIRRSSGDVSVMIYHEDDLFGLAFELDRRLVRVDDDKGHDRVEYDLCEAAHRLLDGGMKPAILVARSTHRRDVEAALQHVATEASPWQVVHLTDWDLYMATTR